MAYRSRLVVITALSVALISSLTALTLYFGMAHALSDSFDNTLRERAQDVTGYFGYQPQSNTDNRQPMQPGSAIHLPAPPTSQTRTDVQFLTAGGVVIEPAGESLRVPPTTKEIAVARGQLAEAFVTHTINGVTVRTYTAPVGYQIAVQVSRPTSENATTLADLRVDLGLIAAGGTLIAVLLAIAVSSAMMAPLRRATLGIRSVRHSGDLSLRLDDGPDEIGQIGQAFNEMLADLQQAAQQQQRFIADASHELRTPITALRVNVELLGDLELFPEAERQQLITDLVVQLDEVSELVSDLVEMARDDEIEEPTELQLDELVGKIVTRVKRQFPEADLQYKSEPCSVIGASRASTRAVSNIIHNAIQFAGDQSIEISVRDNQLQVRDHGPGIPEDDLEKVFERFYRSARSRTLPGSGLGLSMVAQAAALVGGRAWAENAPGGGALITLALPAADAVDKNHLKTS
jgi:two-component system sensor histidine kinase MprB